jgi:hypothetical protein
MLTKRFGKKTEEITVKRDVLAEREDEMWP